MMIILVKIIHRRLCWTKPLALGGSKWRELKCEFKPMFPNIRSDVVEFMHKFDRNTA